MNDSLDHLLRTAIRARHLIRFHYKNHERIAEPHDYGIQNGTVRLFCYQVAGHSSGKLPGWRLVNVSEMQDCEMLETKFTGNRETPSGSHLHWDGLFLRARPPKNQPEKGD